MPNSYLASSNTNYRLYYAGNGSLELYDFSDQYNPAFMMTVGVGNYGDDDPSVFVYSDSECTESFASLGPFNWTLWSDDDQCVGGASTGGTPDGVNFLKLDNDGCLRVYDQDGGRVRWGLPSPEGCFE